MSFRFTCTACRTVMKVQDGFIEPKKVRCTGCGIVVLLTPDPDEPEDIVVSYPRKGQKRTEMSDAKKRVILLGILGSIALVVGGVLWWTLRGPADRSAISGDVSYEGGRMEDGIIQFTQLDNEKPITATGTIKRGRYSIRASQGPGLGANRVQVLGNANEPVGSAYSGEESMLRWDVTPGANTKADFDVFKK